MGARCRCRNTGAVRPPTRTRAARTPAPGPVLTKAGRADTSLSLAIGWEHPPPHCIIPPVNKWTRPVVLAAPSRLLTPCAGDRPRATSTRISSTDVRGLPPSVMSDAPFAV